MTDLELACESFRKLMLEQIERVANASDEKVDFTNKPVVTIGIIDGDGIGPLIMKQAVQVLTALLQDEIEDGRIILKKIEGLTI